MTPAQHFQSIFDYMGTVDKLPEFAALGSLCKTQDGTPYVWYGRWIKLDENMRFIAEDEHDRPE